MCADAKARGVPCAGMDGYLLLPQAPQPGLHDYYAHISEIGGKIKQDLKELGCWQADPRVGGVKGYAPAPGRGVEVMNWHNLRTSFHRWNPDVAGRCADVEGVEEDARDDFHRRQVHSVESGVLDLGRDTRGSHLVHQRSVLRENPEGADSTDIQTSTTTPRESKIKTKGTNTTTAKNHKPTQTQTQKQHNNLNHKHNLNTYAEAKATTNAQTS